MSMESIVKMEKAAKFYGGRLIFKNISLKLDAGDTFLLTGDNGAGKTTLLRMLAGLTEPDSGVIVRKLESPAAFLGHETCLYPGMTALENLEFWAAMSGKPQKQGELMRELEEMNLAAFAHQPSRHFSRGMAQRLNFARVALAKPALLLLDEPFTGMDAKSVELAALKLKSLLANGAAMVMTSHFPERDSAFASKRLHIHNHCAHLASNSAPSC